MKDRFFLKFLLFSIVSSIILISVAMMTGALLPKELISTSGDPDRPEKMTVIIDAGHGGEDGGTVGVNGLIEKDVNLDISNILCDMLRASGVNVVMTRTDDRLLYDRNTDYQGRKKKLDLAARLAIADKTPNALLISIHMNSFTDPQYAGLQVWYSPNNTGSSALAELIRAENRDMLQPGNNRRTKEATSAINLLHNASCPAVLVECGFLSNPEEAKLFESYEYKRKVAFAIFCAVTEYLQTPTISG